MWCGDEGWGTRGGRCPAETRRRPAPHPSPPTTPSRQCKGIASLHGLYEDDANAYVCLEFVGGGDLEALARANAPFSEKDAAALTFELLKALAACHACGVVHGDVKPANVMVRGVGLKAGAVPSLALSDFGLARAPDRGGGVVTGCRGTPVFM